MGGLLVRWVSKLWICRMEVNRFQLFESSGAMWR